MKIIKCKDIREDMLKEAREKIASIHKKLKLAIIQVKGDEASEVYIKNKVKTAESVGIDVVIHKLPHNAQTYDVAKVISHYNRDSSVTGVILQLPLPDHLKFYERHLLDLIYESKDVDGLTTENVGKLWTGQPCISPATPTGLLRLLPEDLSEKKVTIINRSDLIGKPLIKLLLDRNATVSVCHSKSKSALDKTIIRSDIVITGIGIAEYFDSWNIRNGQTWIDCGIDRNIDGELCGDLKISDLIGSDVNITPVPGGVGILTTAQLMLNVIKAYESQEG